MAVMVMEDSLKCQLTFREDLKKYGKIAKCVKEVERGLLMFPVTHAADQGRFLMRRPRGVVADNDKRHLSRAGKITS
jgi:hypothetical protein